MQTLHLLWHLKNKKTRKKNKTQNKQETHGEHLVSPRSQYFCPVTMEISQTVGVL